MRREARGADQMLGLSLVERVAGVGYRRGWAGADDVTAGRHGSGPRHQTAG